MISPLFQTRILPKPKTYFIKTFGCKANTYDSLALEKRLQDLGYEPEMKRPDLLIFNTCTVTDDADRGFRREFRKRFKRLNPGLVIVTGCLAETSPEDVLREWEGAPLLVAGTLNRDKVIRAAELHAKKQDALLELGWKIAPKHRTLKEDEVFSGIPPKDSLRTRALIKIQEGCEVMCTFCIIPMARGRSRSRRSGDLLVELEALEAQGIKEVVITGTHLPDYRDSDRGGDFIDLIELFLKKTKAIRFRVSSLEPPEVTERLLNLMKNEERLCPHIHLSLQSTETEVLERMNRKYTQREVIEAFQRIHRILPEAFVGMDLITCFPGETDLNHRETIRVLSENPWTKIHVFPYSKRSGTPAAHFQDQVKSHIRRERIQELLKLSEKRHQEELQKQVGKTGIVLVERESKKYPGFLKGYTENYFSALIPEEDALENEFSHVELSLLKGEETLTGRLSHSNQHPTL